MTSTLAELSRILVFPIWNSRQFRNEFRFRMLNKQRPGPMRGGGEGTVWGWSGEQRNGQELAVPTLGAMSTRHQFHPLVRPTAAPFSEHPQRAGGGSGPRRTDPLDIFVLPVLACEAPDYARHLVSPMFILSTCTAEQCPAAAFR